VVRRVKANKSSFVSGSQTPLFPEGEFPPSVQSYCGGRATTPILFLSMATRVTRPSEMNVKNLQRDAGNG